MHNKKKKNNKLKIIGQKIHLIIDLASRVKVKTILIILTIHLIFKILFKRKDSQMKPQQQDFFQQKTGNCSKIQENLMNLIYGYMMKKIKVWNNNYTKQENLYR